MGYYEYGKGAARDVTRAYMWYNTASANGFNSASKRLDLLEKTIMTQKQVKKAQSLAKRCIAKHYKGC
ncbi:MAG: hypothetical protein V6Z86_03210 [Hyphomicrobiales bacterium]